MDKITSIQGEQANKMPFFRKFALKNILMAAMSRIGRGLIFSGF